MKKILITLFVEYIKVIRSKIFWGSVFFVIFISLMMGILFFIVKNPEVAKTSVILRAKANMIGNADWKTFTEIMNLMIAIIGFFGFNTITTWIFGREYTDKTLKDLLSLPIPRHNIVLAKYIMISLWSMLLSFLLYIFSFISACIIGLEGWKPGMLLYGLKIYLIITVMNILLSTINGCLSSIGRGYFLSLGFIFFTLLLSNFAINISENAKYIPWAIPLIYAGSSIKEGISINFVSIIILFTSSLSGFLATLYWWKYGDQY